MSKPEFLGYPPPPIAFAPGHQPGCYNSCGNYRSCVDKCPASLNWGQHMKAAYEAHDAEWRRMRDEPPPPSPTGSEP